VRSAPNELFRYVIVGVATNTVGYLLYLAFTAMGTEPKFAMTVLYVMGMAQSFFFNHQWAFGRGALDKSLARYLVAHAMAYSLNFALLSVFADSMGFPHQIVQAGGIVAVAMFLFVMFRYWVFKD
jgi:putative flippase GtrA